MSRLEAAIAAEAKARAATGTPAWDLEAFLAAERELKAAQAEADLTERQRRAEADAEAARARGEQRVREAAEAAETERQRRAPFEQAIAELRQVFDLKLPDEHVRALVGAKVAIQKARDAALTVARQKDEAAAKIAPLRKELGDALPPGWVHRHYPGDVPTDAQRGLGDQIVAARLDVLLRPGMTLARAVLETRTEGATLLPLATMLAEAGGPDLCPREVTTDERVLSDGTAANSRGAVAAFRRFVGSDPTPPSPPAPSASISSTTLQAG